MPKLYLGTHEPSWLRTARVPLFISHRRLSRQRTWPKAANVWALDSGGFSEISMYGEWRTTPREYVDAVMTYDDAIGKLEWAAPQDYMCEPVMLEKTGLSIDDHQKRTVANFCELQELWDNGTDCPFMPVLQGWTIHDYVRCMDVYAEFGIGLDRYPLVGVGSVCRRQATDEIAEILGILKVIDPDMPLHGFGVKTLGLRSYGHLLTSSDTMAWSFNARKNEPLPGCTHAKCSNCLKFATTWRRGIVGPACTAHGEPCDGCLAELPRPTNSALLATVDDMFGAPE